MAAKGGGAFSLGLMAAALDRFLEADQADRRDRKLRPLVRRLDAALGKWFAEQGRLFLRSLSQFESRFQENLYPSDWLPLIAAIQNSTRGMATEEMGELILEALILGGGDLMKGLGIAQDDPDFTTRFKIDDIEAIQYAARHAAELVTQIDDTTRRYMNTLITQAVENGWSYDRLAQAITDRFAEFSEERALRIAVYELGDAFEYGRWLQAKQLEAAGLEMEKGWLTAGDDRVRPTHQSNGAQGWIPIDDDFSSGHPRPPTDPGCRCAGLYRRKP